MRIALAGLRDAGSASFRVGVFALAACLAACSGKPATGALQVLVELEPGLTSRCVKVTATDGTNSKETKPIGLAGKSSPLHVAIYGDGLVQPVTIQAVGYADEGCTMLSSEVSESVEGTFTNPPSTVTVTLRPQANGDGGFRPDGGGSDGGVDAGADAGVDAGPVDAGVDVDMDGYPLPADCDDSDPAVHPGASESTACRNGIDDNCNGVADCQDSACDGFVCSANGLCTNEVCVGTVESPCNDGRDNNANGLVDCADPGCTVGMTCNDSNACTTGDQCTADGGCAKTGDVMCSTPPNGGVCYGASGTCLPDAGASCQYTALSGTGCDDGLGCTTGDSCTAGSCDGTPRTCPLPSNTCLSTVGACQEPDGGCLNAPLPVGTGTCSDGVNCSINDTCDGDGGCAGTMVSCPRPSQCHSATTGCAADGGCQFNPLSGQSCDAGSGLGAATCDSTFNCNLGAATLFPYTPSNFAENQLPNDGGVVMNVTTSRTLNTDTATLTPGTMPPFTVFTPPSGEPTLLIQVTALNVSGGAILTLAGSRPVIFAVTGNVLIDGVVRASNVGSPTACGHGANGDSGGGGGFGTAGAAGGRPVGSVGIGGGANGSPNVTPIRSGCRGGTGPQAGGDGGGSVQISASGTMTINNTVTAPGLGGAGNAANSNNGGGGGGSGGAILVEANVLVFAATTKLTANGGGGGGGSDDLIAPDGADGSEILATAAAGGAAGGGGGGRGGNGGSRGTPPTAGLSVNSNDGAGGGGGAVGRIRIRAGSCTVTGSQVISPQATSTGTNCPN